MFGMHNMHYSAAALHVSLNDPLQLARSVVHKKRESELHDPSRCTIMTTVVINLSSS